MWLSHIPQRSGNLLYILVLEYSRFHFLFISFPILPNLTKTKRLVLKCWKNISAVKFGIHVYKKTSSHKNDLLLQKYLAMTLTTIINSIIDLLSYEISMYVFLTPLDGESERDKYQIAPLPMRQLPQYIQKDPIVDEWMNEELAVGSTEYACLVESVNVGLSLIVGPELLLPGKNPLPACLSWCLCDSFPIYISLNLSFVMYTTL